MPKAALARPLPTRQTRKKGRLNFLYPAFAGALRLQAGQHNADEAIAVTPRWDMGTLPAV